MIFLVFCTIVFLILILLINTEFSQMTPIDNDISGLYYKNRIGVYIYYPRDCGYIGCIGPGKHVTRKLFAS